MTELETGQLKGRLPKQRLVQLVKRFTERPARSIQAAYENWAETKAT